ncbi:hypothetical protein BGX30_005960 [Mortierella sp. GBA39]|nr:hypothetical protein BGX30_005960 [Mortierella sp. GBA39]
MRKFSSTPTASSPSHRPTNADSARVQETTPTTKTTIFRQYFRMAHFREVNRIIASPILVQLQTLTIPVSDIKRYIGVIDRLLELENVLFILDELFVYDPRDIPTYNNDDVPAEVEEVLRTTKAREEAAMQGMVLFVEEHNRQFNNQLRTVVCPVSHIWTGAAWVSPETVQFELLKMLRMLRAPTSIDKLNWVQFVSHVSLTDLKFRRSPSLTIQDSHMTSSATTETFSSGVVLSGRSICRPLDLLGSTGKEGLDGFGNRRRKFIAATTWVGATGGHESRTAPLTDKMDDIVPNLQTTRSTDGEILGPPLPNLAASVLSFRQECFILDSGVQGKRIFRR